MSNQQYRFARRGLGRLVSLASLAAITMLFATPAPGASGSASGLAFAPRPQAVGSGEPGVWTKYAGNPVLTASQAWEGSMWAAWVLKDGTTYKMWYTSVFSVGYASSMDGTNWDKYAGNPILVAGSAGEWDEAGVGEPYVLKEGGAYKMWYWGVNTNHIRQIGYATSPDGMTWSKHGGNPVMTVGGTGTWNELEVGTPFVLHAGNTYQMWYTGQNGGGSYALGYATSPDGINWSAYAGNPILQGGPGTFDETGPLAPKLYYDGRSYRMWYFGHDAGDKCRIGYATSSNGTAWNKWRANPILDLGPGGSWESECVAFAAVMLDGGTYEMWYHGASPVTGSIGYATAPEIPLLYLPCVLQLSAP